MKTCFLFALTLSVAIGCTSSYEIANEPAPDKHSFAQVNEDAKGQSFTISTVNGEEIDATDLFVRGDSTSFLESSVTSRSTIPTSSVETITIKQAGVGALDGLVWGAIVGAGSIVILGVILTPFSAYDDSDTWAEFAAWAAAATVLGGGVGAGVGAIIGHTDEYIFQSTNNNSQKEK